MAAQRVVVVGGGGGSDDDIDEFGADKSTSFGCNRAS